jgi:hypothetical protein
MYIRKLFLSIMYRGSSCGCDDFIVPEEAVCLFSYACNKRGYPKAVFLDTLFC